MVDKANELPLSQVDDALRHTKCHMNDSNLLIHRCCCLVCKQRIVNDPRLRHRLLGVVELMDLVDLRSHEAQQLFITSLLLIDDGANESSFISDCALIHEPEL